MIVEWFFVCRLFVYTIQFLSNAGGKERRTNSSFSCLFLSTVTRINGTLGVYILH